MGLGYGKLKSYTLYVSEGMQPGVGREGDRASERQNHELVKNKKAWV
jgi:hypothetical protein